MRILWVKAGGLWPLTAGGRIRSFHIARELARRHEVEVVTTHAPGDPSGLPPGWEPGVSLAHAAPKQGTPGFAAALVRSWGSGLPVDLWRWRVPAVRRAVAAALRAEPFDVCVADFLSAVPNLPSHPGVPVVLFEHNVEHVIWRRLAAGATGVQRPLLDVEWRKVRRYERRACLDASLTVAVSEEDRAALAALAPGAAVAAVPTGVDTEYFSPRGTDVDERSIAFVGSMDWFPNEQGALQLIDDVLPRVREEEPAATLVLVGRNPSERLRAAAQRGGAQVTGTVDDIRPHMARAAVVVVPLEVGGGTRLKIFEALAMGKAVVSTTIGAEGLPLTPGEHYVRADGAQELARATVELLRDEPRRRALGAAGRAFVTERYSWARAGDEFEAHCRAAIAARDTARAAARKSAALATSGYKRSG